MYTPLDDSSDLCGKTISHVFSTRYDEIILLTQDMRACKFYVDDGDLSFRGMSDNGLLSWLSPCQQVQAGLLTEQEQIEKEAEKARIAEARNLKNRHDQYLRLKAEFEPGPTQGSLF